MASITNVFVRKNTSLGYQATHVVKESSQVQTNWDEATESTATWPSGGSEELAVKRWQAKSAFDTNTLTNKCSVFCMLDTIEKKFGIATSSDGKFS